MSGVLDPSRGSSSATLSSSRRYQLGLQLSPQHRVLGILGLDHRPQPGGQLTLIPAVDRPTRLTGHKPRACSTSANGSSIPRPESHHALNPGKSPRSPVLCQADAMGTMQRIAPIFAVRDLDAAMRHYQRLGFTVRAYAGGGYGYATRDGIEIHLGVVPGDHHRTSSAYLFVDNAGDLAAAWRSAGAEVHPSQHAEWGQHEGAVADPDGNVIRFGSPIGKAAQG